jgi:hypothetical protein
MTEENGSRRDRLTLSPPTFSIPNDLDDYELWTVRLPTSLNIEALQGIELDAEKLGIFQAESMAYGMTYGHPVENENFRLLLKSGDFLHFHDQPFTRHVNVVDAMSLKDTVGTELAPRLETAPPTADPVRKSYSHIPQASGLKRRWMPPGTGAPSSAAAVVIAPFTRAPKRDEALTLSASLKTNVSVANEPDYKGTNGSAASERYSMETNGSEPDAKRVKLEETTPRMNGGDARQMTKKEKKAAKKAEKKAKKERKQEKKGKKKAKS